MSSNKSWGAIFDWDGVVIDSSKAHSKSWVLLSAEEKRGLPDGFFKRSFGMKNETIIPQLLGWASDPAEVTRLGERKEALYRDIIRAEGVIPIPGTKQMLERLEAAGVPCAVGSSTPLVNIECGLELIGEHDYFETIVAAGDVVHGKPAPDIFLLAAKRIGRPPERCIVFEDAHAGIAAARAGGMKIIALSTTHAPETLQDADLVVPSLEHVTVDQLEQLVG